MRRPRFIAEQARDARGLLGRIVAFIMARETWAQNLRGIEALAIEPGDRVLDVGCGHGRSLAALSARTRGGLVVGCDPSRLMGDIASERCRSLIKDGKVDVVVAPAESLPFGDRAFDKALCVHVLYFWDDLGRALREIARVLKPGGRLVLLFRTDGAQAFPAEIYRFRSLEEVLDALSSAGFMPGETERMHGCVLLAAQRPGPGDT